MSTLAANEDVNRMYALAATPTSSPRDFEALAATPPHVRALFDQCRW
jgi:hypothetical protein